MFLFHSGFVPYIGGGHVAGGAGILDRDLHVLLLEGIGDRAAFEDVRGGAKFDH